MPSKIAPKKSEKVEESTPLVEKTTKSKSKTSSQEQSAQSTKVDSSKGKSKSVKEPKVETVEPVEQSLSEVSNVVEETSLSLDFTSFITNFQELITRFNSLKTELKSLEKKTNKQLKVVQKINNKKKRKGTRAPSGFVKPSPISDELASFLGKEKGVEMARTDVTREINKYIHEHQLQDKENGRKIIPDQQLSKLLGIDTSVNLTYFNLQKYMSPHFPKQSKVATV